MTPIQQSTVTLVQRIRAATATEAVRWMQDALEPLHAAESAGAEMQALFEMQWKRSREADKMWQKATGKHDTIPDLGELLKWLMTQLEAARKDSERLDKLEALATHDNDILLWRTSCNSPRQGCGTQLGKPLAETCAPTLRESIDLFVAMSNTTEDGL